MATERQTLLSRGPTSGGRAIGPDVRAPQAAFGVYDGLNDLGRGVQNAAGTVSHIAGEIENRKIARVNQLDAADMADRYKLVRSNKALQLQKDVNEFQKNGLLGRELDEAVAKRGQELQAEIPLEMDDLRKRNPEVFAKIVSPEALKSDWGTHINGVRGQVEEYSSTVYQEQRWATRLTNTENDLKNVQESPSGSVDIGIRSLTKFGEETGNFTARQRHDYKNVVSAKVLSSLQAGAVFGKTDTLESAKKALDAGLIQPDDHARIVATFSRTTDPKVIAGDITKAFKDITNRVAGGEDLGRDSNLTARYDLATADASLLYVGDDGKFRNTTALYSEVVKPAILAVMQNSLSTPGKSDGFLLGQRFADVNRILAELDNPESEVINQLFQQQYASAKTQAFIQMPNSREAMRATMDEKPSQADFNDYRSALKVKYAAQAELVNNYRANELYTEDPAVSQALAKNDPILIEEAYSKIYDRDGIPEDRRVYANPDHVNKLRARENLGSESEVLETEKLFKQFTKHYGNKGTNALMSLAQGNKPFNGLMAFAAALTQTASPTEAANISSVTTEMWQAIAAQNSADMKKKTSEADQRLLNDVELFSSAALSTTYAGEFNPGAAWAKSQDGELRPLPRNSPFGQAATRAGIYDGLEALNLAMARHYTFTRKSGTFQPNEAAKQVRDILGRAFIPAKINGASDANPSPVYGFVPNIRSGQVPWYVAGQEGQFASQRHASEVYGAALDSFFLAATPNLEFAASTHFAVKGVMARMFSGTHLGGNTELAQMLPINAMAWSIVRDNPKAEILRSHNIPFDRVGVVVEDVEEYKDDYGRPSHRKVEKFIHLSEDRLNIATSNFFPDTVKARVDEAIKRIDPTDRAGRAAIALANNHQWEMNPTTGEWDMYIPTGTNWAGTAGSVSGAGPRVTAVILNEDGKTWRKLSLPAKHVGDRAAEIMNAGSFFRQPGAPSTIRDEMSRQAVDRYNRLPKIFQ